MPKKLTAEQISGYERDGYVCPVDGFTTEQARGWRDRLEAFERAEGRKMTRGHNFKPHLLFPWVDEIVHSPHVLDAVEDLIGPDIRLFHLTVWPKDAQSGAYVSWHQDATYFALEPACHVTAWVALTDAPIEAGCMEVVPGSHRLGQMQHAEMQDPENLLSRGQALAVDVDRTRTFAWRDYGNRIGVWRCLELFDELNLPAAHLINTTVFDYAPQIVDALKARGDEFIGHGRTNAERHGHMWEADEKRFLEEVRDAIEQASGKRPRGWMAPWMASTHHTPDLLKEVGFDFLMDWPADDQPLWMKTRSGPLMSVPYPIEINDSPQVLVRHTMIVGQPYRLRMLREALQHIARHPQKDKVWFTRPSAIYDHCAALPKGTMVPPPA